MTTHNKMVDRDHVNLPPALVLSLVARKECVLDKSFSFEEVSRDIFVF